MSGGGGQGVTWDGERVWINTSGHFSKRRTEEDQEEGDCKYSLSLLKLVVLLC